MDIILRKNVSYSSVITKLSIYTTLSVIGCILFGYIFLPFAAAYYGALITFEKKGKRVMSYAIPAVLFTLNFFLRAAFSLEALVYIILGVLLYFAVQRGWSKSETAVWMTAITILMIILSAILLAFEKTGNIGLLPLRQFYSNIYFNIKEIVLNRLTSVVTLLPNGSKVFVFDIYDAERLFEEMFISIIPISVIFAFALVGLSFKLFKRCLVLNSEEEKSLSDWRFGISNVIVYFYIAVALLSLIAQNDGSIFAQTLITVNTIFSAVFAYVGIRFIFHMITSGGKSTFFAFAVIVFAFILFSSYIITVLSYLGIIISLIENRSSVVSK